MVVMNILAIERRNQILAIIQEEQSVIVSELSKRYKVTEETIRRDLEKLEKDGFVKKTYGGAVYAEGLNKDLPFKIREHSNKNEKISIAKKIAELIEDGDTIMMDASSTVLEVAKLIKDKQRITVITNSVEALIELSDSKNITVISTGGILRESSLSLIGRNAEAVIKNYNVDKTIISCKGIDINKGITDSVEQEVEIKRTMCRMAKQTIMAVDSKKFNRIAFTKLLEFDEIDIVVTNNIEDEKWKEFFNGIHTKVIY